MSVKFNKQQLEAINFYKGACCVIASAGSGKSTSMVNRIKNLIDVHKVNQRDILAISFTNNASKQLKKKLNDMGYLDVNVGTFHSICARILSENGIYVNSLIQEWQIDNCFKTIDPNADVEDIKSFIGYQKSYMKSYKDEFVYKDSCYEEADLRVFYKAYEDFKTKNKLYDFDDWLLMCHEFLKTNEYTFDFINIDENQDSSLIQNLLLKQLCKSGNIFAVGDYRQCLYSFRAAVPELFMNFYKEWDNTTVINLDINYRSCRNIVENSNNFIRKYYGDFKYYTDSIPHNKKDGHIELITTYDKYAESSEVVERIHRLIKKGTNPNDIAVLYRSNSHADYIECELKNRGIPYYIQNDSSFFKRKEVDFIISYLRLIANPHDDGAFVNIFKLRNYPLNYFSNAVLNEVRKYAGNKDMSLYEALITKRYDQSWQSKNVKIFENNINMLRPQKDKNVSIQKLIDNIIKVFNFNEYLETKYRNKEDLKERIGSIEVLKSFIKGNSLEGFLEYVMTTDVKTKKKETDGVKLMTIHGSKGLEWKNVFVVGVEDGKFPHDKSDLLDESRIFFVGITRAMENLYLSQIKHGNRFINEYFN